MAKISFSRASATKVWANATNCIATHTYKIQVQSSSGSWYDKVTDLSGKTSYLVSFSVDGSGSYDARLWDVTILGVGATGTIPKWTSVTVIINNYLNEAPSLEDGSYTGPEDTGFSIMASGTQYQTYSQQYTFKYFTLSSEKYNTKHGTGDQIKIKSGLVVKVYYATKTYPYTTNIYIDGTFVTSATNTTNTESSVAISSLPAYTKYVADYDFDYAKVVGSSGQYNSSSKITLTSGSTTGIQLYFKTKIRSVAPTISSISTTNTTATINWSKNGGTNGTWIVYYGLSTSSMVSGGYVTSSPAKITGLTAGKTYIFYIQNYVSSSDKANSDYATAATKSAIEYFAWTSNDTANIKAGQPIKNITASAWQNLIAKVAACGGSTASIPSASSGTRITANHFNQMRNAISNLTGAGSVVSSVTSGTSRILATLFANASTALKEAINRAISAKNNG